MDVFSYFEEKTKDFGKLICCLGARMRMLNFAATVGSIEWEEKVVFCV